MHGPFLPRDWPYFLQIYFSPNLLVSRGTFFRLQIIYNFNCAWPENSLCSRIVIFVIGRIYTRGRLRRLNINTRNEADALNVRRIKRPKLTGAPNVNFRKVTVRKMIWDLEFSEHLLWNLLLAGLSEDFRTSKKWCNCPFLTDFLL